jgi:hypothetical protein
MVRLLILGAIYLTTGLLPLWTHVGQNFEYEYALLASWTALFLIPLAALILPDRWLGLENHVFTPSKTLEGYWIFFLSPLIVPLIALWYFSRQICQCSNAGYVFWMALIWYPAWISAHGLHHLLLRARCLGKKRFHLFSSLFAIYVLMLIDVGISLWFNPQKRLVHQFAGFLHGPIYDTWIPVDNGLLWTRVSHVFAGGILLCAAWWRRSWLSYSLSAAAVAGWFCFGSLAQEYGSISLGKDALNRLLPGTRRHDAFTLHYVPRRNPQGKEQGIGKDILRLEKASEFHIKELSEIFKDNKLPHVDIYVYPSQDEKKLWFGGGATDVTDVHTPSLHITSAGWNHPTLRHELVHALASRFGFFGLGFHPNMAFTEGLAVALAPEENTISLDDGAAAIIDSKRISNVENLFSPFFWKESGERAYTLAGSLIRFLIDRYGIAGVKAKYSGSSWKKAFSKDQSVLLEEWTTQITSHFDGKIYGMYAETLFRNPGLFRTLCPHSRADLRQSRTNNPYVRLRQPIGWMPEDDYQAWIQTIDPNDFGNRLASWRKKIDAVVNDSAKNETKMATWEKVLNQARNQPPKVLEDIEIAVLESDLLRIAGKKAESIAILNELTQIGKNIFLGESLTREIYTRLKLEDLDPTNIIRWRMYLAGWHASPPAKAAATDPWLISYLRLRRLDAEPFDQESLDKFLAADLDPELPETFRVEWYRYLAYRYLKMENYPRAAAAWKKAAATAPGPKKDAFLMYSREADFFAKSVTSDL